MVTFPNCKINLGLHILQKRKDGYHDIQTVFFPVPVYDILEIISFPGGKTQFYNTGIFTGSLENNLCLRAFQLIKKDFPELPGIKMHLHKVIPIGAGLGGGSADGAFTLSLLNKKYNLNISAKRINEYALQLGSDCPFFLSNKPSLATGRGEILEPIQLSLSGYKMLLVNPNIHLNTKKIFEKVIPAHPAKEIKDIIQQPLSTWKEELANDFEKVVFPEYPQIAQIKESLYQHGALYAAMTGTGSTVLGIFNRNETINYTIAEGYFHRWTNLS